MGVFWRKGYDGTSCEDLLAAMGLNSGSMYASFGDKKTLYDKAFDLYCETMFSKGLAVLDGTGSPLENVRALVECIGENLLSSDCKGCFVGNTLIEFAAENKGVAETARRVMQRLQDAFEQKLSEASSTGELSSELNPKEIAAFLVSTAQGLNVMARAGAGKETIHAIIKTTLSMLR